MPHQRETGWANPKVITILAVVFLCGAAVGAAAMRQYLHRWFLVPATVQGSFIAHNHRVTFKTLKEDLNLTPAQEQTVKDVLDDFAKYYQNLEEQREDVTEAGKRRIDNVLDPQQKKKFQELVQDPAAK
jgi:Spy/CpxP family protein refolding chaperone